MNKIFPHLDQLKSFLYAQETTKFSVTFGAEVPSDEFRKAPILNRLLRQEWHSSNGDINFGLAVLWSLIYDSMFMKLLYKDGGVAPTLVEPGMFGVLREDAMQLSAQEAVMHQFSITKRNLETQLRDHPRGEYILSMLNAVEKGQPENEGLSRLMVSAVSPNITGNVDVPQMLSAWEPRPQVAEPMIDMYELWVYDTDAKDFRIVTIANPHIIVFDRRASDLVDGKPMYLKGELPFRKICVNPRPDYFWGESEVGRLVPLQDMLTNRMFGIRNMLDRQAEPPHIGAGLYGQPDEITRAFTTPNGYIAAGDSSFKLEEIKPQIPEDLFADVRMIFDMFSETSGMSNVTMGKGEAGVRSQGHAAELARLGSSRAKQRALIIEDSLEDIATLYLKLMRTFGDDQLQDETGQEFKLFQVNPDFSVKVDGHSSSPIFMEDAKELAFALKEAGAISNDMLLELTQPPLLELIKIKLPEVEQKAAAAQQQQLTRVK